jgi:Holliday junction resolvase RusA-like endonuclease
MADVDVASNVSPYESAYKDATTTSQQVQFRVDGDPKAQQRPRMCHRKQGKPYLCNPDMRLKVAFRKKVVSNLHSNGRDETKFPIFERGTPVHLRVEYYFRRPMAHFKPNSNSSDRLSSDRLLMRGKLNDWPKRTDLDNLDKFLLDALEGILFQNDCQVVPLHSSKAYHDLQSTGFTLVDAKSMRGFIK